MNALLTTASLDPAVRVPARAGSRDFAEPASGRFRDSPLALRRRSFAPFVFRANSASGWTHAQSDPNVRTFRISSRRQGSGCSTLIGADWRAKDTLTAEAILPAPSPKHF